MNRPRSIRAAVLLLAVATLGALAFGYGVFVGKYEVAPYATVRSLYYRTIPYGMRDRLTGLERVVGSEYVDTNLILFEKRVFEIGEEIGLETSSGAGAVTPFGDDLLGVDSRGAFFVYEGQGVAKRLEIPFDQNLSAFVRYLEGEQNSERTLARFRVHDLLARTEPDRTTLFVSHHYWNERASCVEFRASRMVIEASADEIVHRGGHPTGTWQTLMVAEPCLPADAEFTGHQAGGRLLVESPDQLLVTIGDHAYDGVERAEAYPQRDDVSYGKLVRIDIDSRTTEVVAKGFRNSQGLIRDDEGRIWATDHGPKGGDELNIVREGGNYGWPVVSYGTDYDAYAWPLADAQGRHVGYERPVYVWTPAIAVSNLIQIGARPVEWAGDLIASSLAARSLFRLRYREGRVLFAEPIEIGVRIRDIDQLPDGTIVLWTDRASIVELRRVDQGTLDAATRLTEAEIGAGLEGVVEDCTECHSLRPGGQASNAPPLWGVGERAVAGSDFTGYSEALREVGGEWSVERLAEYLADPQEFAPGTTMPDPGIDDPVVLEALAGYLLRLR